MEPDTYLLMRELEDEHWWFVARRKIIRKLLETLGLSEDCRILEVGCGTGGNLDVLGKFGSVTGVELESIAAQMARARDIAPVYTGGLPDDLPELSENFDLICLFDVIEHIEDDESSLQALKKRLNSNGKIVITVPAFPFLWSQHDDENHHHRRYRRRDISRLAETAKMNVEYMSYFNFWLFPPVAALRLFRKIWPYRESWKDMSKPGDGLNRLLESVFASERHMVGKFSLPFGISLIAVLSDRNS